MSAPLRAAWRLLRVVVHVLHGMAVVAWHGPKASAATRHAYIGWWAAKFVRLLGVRLSAHGLYHPGATLLVANHVSWLDILVIHAVQPRARFVSKADVKHWPLLGWLIGAVGTLFIERERRRDAMRVVHQMADALRAGDCVAVFPEGTTGTGLPLLPFHANLLQAAIVTGTPIQAVALRYEDVDAGDSTGAEGNADAPGRFSNVVAWVGETTLLQSVWQLLCSPGLKAVVWALPPQATVHAERRLLAGSLSEEITRALQSPVPPKAT